MSTFRQHSFSGGEIAPALYSRVDTTKYAAGLRTCRNFVVMRHGGAQNRPGTEYVAEVKDSSNESGHRLIPFVFNASQTYVIELGVEYMRFYKDGAQVTVSGVSAWANGTAYVAGDLSSYGGGNYYCFNPHTSATANDRPGTGTNWQDYWHALSGSIYEIPTPYAAADLDDLQYVQSADVITIVHPSYPPRELSRTADTTWTLEVVSFIPEIDPPTALTNSGATTYTQRLISSITLASPMQVTTSTNHLWTVNDTVAVRLVIRTDTTWNIRKIIDRTLVVASTPAANTATFNNLDGTAFDSTNLGGTFVSGGSYGIEYGTTAGDAWPTVYKVTSIDPVTFDESVASVPTGTTTIPATTAQVTVSWTAVAGVREYNVYRKSGNIYGYIGTTPTNSFIDFGVQPDTTLSPPEYKVELFNDTDEYPAAVGYYQQRLVLSNTNNNTEQIHASRTGSYKNFTTSFPLQDDDAIKFTVAGNQVNEVRHTLDLGKLVILTSGGEGAAEGGADGVLTPTSINYRQQSYNGSSKLKPVIIGNTALYVQARGSVVRDLGYDFQADGYRGNDLTIFASHLFDDYNLVDMAYAQIPHSVLWIVRDDGKLLGLTYVKEHQVWAWHQHDTDGTFENVCVVPEGTEDAVYVIVKRTINSVTQRYVERFHTRRVDDIVDSVFMDSSATYDGRNTAATTMTLSGGTNWTNDETLTLTASAATFAGASTDVGNEVRMRVGTASVRCQIVTHNSTTVCSVRPIATVPVALRSVATADWDLAVDSVSGLSHLEGEEVSIFADGFVVANPNNPSYPTYTVTSGAVTLPAAYAVIHVGLPYLSDLQTLDIDTIQGETMIGKKKLINKVTVYLDDSRGLWAGAAPPSDDTTNAVEGLRELKKRVDENYEEPVDLVTGAEDIIIRSEWNSNGRVFLRQVDPLPLTILSVNPSGLIPGSRP